MDFWKNGWESGERGLFLWNAKWRGSERVGKCYKFLSDGRINILVFDDYWFRTLMSLI
nr:hypothetical protein [Candidatus Freyarchaeota archaeon]